MKKNRIKSRRTNKSQKPAKPYSNYPLTPRPCGKWCKTIRGKLYYFGTWGKRKSGKIIRVLDDGWEAALAEYESQAVNLHAGREPRADQNGITIAGLIDWFLTHKRTLLDNGELSPRTFGDWYFDKTTGDHLNRPAFEQLQLDIFNREIQTVVVWKLDRLSRNLRDGINVLADWCDRGLQVVSVTQQIDFNGALSKMLAAVLLGIAEMEQETRRERQRAGIEVAKKKGIYKGRQPGTTKAKPERARQLKERGMKQTEIAKALDVSRMTVSRYLNRRPSNSAAAPVVPEPANGSMINSPGDAFDRS